MLPGFQGNYVHLAVSYTLSSSAGMLRLKSMSEGRVMESRSLCSYQFSPD